MFAYDISTRFACSSLLYRSFTLDEALDGIAQSGFAYVDLWAVPAVLAHVDPSADDPSQIKARLAERGLLGSSITVYGATDAEVGAALKFAAAIGARTVIATAPPVDYERREASDDVRALGRDAQEAGVSLCLTNQQDTWVGGPEEIASFLDDVGHPRVQLSLSPPHAHVAGDSIEAIADAAGNRIGHTYLWSVAAEAASEDDFGPSEDQVPGQGAVDVGALMGMLETRGYNGNFTFMWHGTQTWSLQQICDRLVAARAHVLEASKAP